MKKIDVYVARAYVVRFIMAHVVIFGLYISFDMLQRIDMFYGAGAGRTVRQVFAFYLYQLPSNIMDTVPPLLMLSAGLVFVNMNRNGELLTLKASGISIRRVAFPVFMVTIPVVAFLGLAQEMFIPNLYRQRTLLENKIEGRVTGPFLLADRENGYRLFVGEYDFKEEKMINVTLMLPHGDALGDERILEADSASWAKANALLFKRASIQDFDVRGRPAGEIEAFESTRWPTSLTPADLIDAQDDELTARAPAMTLSELVRRMEENPHNPRFRVLFHTRLADKLVPIILLLIGIPLLVGSGKNPQSRMVGALVVIVVTGVYYVLTFIVLSIANAGAVPPAFAAWLMPGIGMLTGLTMFGMMHS